MPLNKFNQPTNELLSLLQRNTKISRWWRHKDYNPVSEMKTIRQTEYFDFIEKKHFVWRRVRLKFANVWMKWTSTQNSHDDTDTPLFASFKTYSLCHCWKYSVGCFKHDWFWLNNVKAHYKNSGDVNNYTFSKMYGIIPSANS